MLSAIIKASIRHRILVLLGTLAIIVFGLYALSRIPIGAVPDITNNQVQVITTSRNLSTQDMEQFITYAVELEMANLPGVKEIRSVSKFGLSVVTIVFEDKMGTYLPRQLIAEKIQSALENIPEGFGKPEMGPISTGLGEIYQYTLDVRPEFAHKYSPMELRTIQDWVVKRQLSGIPGVVEVNTWGGFLKQYEVALDPAKLRAFDITAHEVFRALEQNNQVAGGGYIEKEDQAYFIRSEGLAGSLEDIGAIVVKKLENRPVYIADVAEVGFGHATRFGAITANGEGEKVLGQVMMLKDANSNQVIEAVKARVAEIGKTLPEGVYINGFLDRSELIAKTTDTVKENLILGCLIVIFVVVLLLGNWRSGLLVASVIPLSLLFALGLMYVFGVDANLMSLGAIDFGIIIDGAVIIVEFISFQMAQRVDSMAHLQPHAVRLERKKLAVEGAQKMMGSAIFGQWIILIVFIPILSLSGVEGKMFKPMALTFGFALIGAMLLCLTYVPVAASMILKPVKPNPKGISARLMRFLEAKYVIGLEKALAHKVKVLAVGGLLLVVSIGIFSRMGGEFMPTLDEGDFVIQPVLPTGTSLAKTTEITTQIEKLLLERFPEVDQVVTRIGAAEVPTDPMSMEESDIIITLNDPTTWSTADTKDGLADAFKRALEEEIPDMEVEFTQPIEMRFNELITGVRADIAIKLFGEDLQVLANKAEAIGRAIANIPGAADISVEKIEGLPQMRVSFDRKKLARFGVSIGEINDLIAMGFAGKASGVVFEGEKRFDLVVRIAQQGRTDIEDLKRLYVPLPNGSQVPLAQLASISYSSGAAQISRDDTRRRAVIGVNVRNRDLQSVVDDVKARIESEVELPVGYSVQYGGQFENLQSAKDRLKIAVPVALLLIFIFLYFAFGSVRDAILVYSAIPLAAVGGILLLWFRDMPFSISAGVGFIALFGIAVLNGIVMIEHFKVLKKDAYRSEGWIITGAKDRLRAVLLTATAAALGFLPMAVSTSAGAEVQRPLATVVIGGLFTATLLTLFVLPVLYAYFHKEQKMRLNPQKTTLLLLAFVPFMGGAQQQDPVLDSLLAHGLRSYKGLEIAELEVQQLKALRATAFDLGKTELYWGEDQNNLGPNNQPLQVWGVGQEIPFPTRFFGQSKYLGQRLREKEIDKSLQEKEWRRALYLGYDEWGYVQARLQVLNLLDSLYSDFAHAAKRKFELGESNYLEQLTAKAEAREIQMAQKAQTHELEKVVRHLSTLAPTYEFGLAERGAYVRLAVDTLSFGFTHETDRLNVMNTMAVSARKLSQQALLPDLNATYFQGSNSSLEGTINGFQLGIKFPLFFHAQSGRIKAAKRVELAQQAQFEKHSLEIEARKKELLAEFRKQIEALAYYESEGLELSNQLYLSAEMGYKNGELDYLQYLQTLHKAQRLRLAYLDALHAYNKAVIHLNYPSL